MPYSPADILLDKYRIEALLGQGAFGEVYRVTHLGLNVQRALKVLRRDAPGIGSTEFNDGQARFQLEAQLGAQLNLPTPHPNLLQVHNFEKAGNLLALEMEYAPGGSLLERLGKAREQGQPMPIEEALQIALEVASGLAVLHARDIVHRDIKPSNILFDGKGRAKLADLGLAQIPGGPSLRSQLSNPLPHPGTPGYMSPEQENARGILRPPSDVYALGLVLFEMLTRHNYFFVKSGTKANSIRQEVSIELNELLVRMLAKSPDDRPWDGQEIAGLLKRMLDHLQNGKAKAQKKDWLRKIFHLKLKYVSIIISVVILMLLLFFSVNMRLPESIPYPTTPPPLHTPTKTKRGITITPTLNPTFTPTPSATKISLATLTPLQNNSPVPQPTTFIKTSNKTSGYSPLDITFTINNIPDECNTQGCEILWQVYTILPNPVYYSGWINIESRKEFKYEFTDRSDFGQGKANYQKEYTVQVSIRFTHDKVIFFQSGIPVLIY